MSWLTKIWSTFGDMEAQKSWEAGEDDGPQDEVEYTRFLESFGEAAYRPDGKLKRPEDFTDPRNAELARQVWQTGARPTPLHSTEEPELSPAPSPGLAEPEYEPRVSTLEARPPLPSPIPQVSVHVNSSGFSGPEKTRISLQPQDAPPRYGSQPRAVMTTVAPFIIDPEAVANAAEAADRQRRNDLVRIQQAVESLATLGYWDAYYTAQEFRIKFVDWLPGGAAGFTNPLTGTIYVVRDANPSQSVLLSTLVHECEHVRGWIGLGRWPRHEENLDATPAEERVQDDYQDALLNGRITEDGVAPRPSLQVGPRRKEGQPSSAGEAPSGSEREGDRPRDSLSPGSIV